MHQHRIANIRDTSWEYDIDYLPDKVFSYNFEKGHNPVIRDLYAELEAQIAGLKGTVEAEVGEPARPRRADEGGVHTFRRVHDVALEQKRGALALVAARMAAHPRARCKPAPTAASACGPPAR